MALIDKYSALLFDLDGLMFNTEEIAHEAISYVVSKFGGTFSDEIHSKILGTQALYYVPYIIKDTGIDCTVDEFRRLERERFFENYDQKVKKLPGLDQILDLGRVSGKKMAVVTSSTLSSAKKELGAFDLEDFFDGLITADMIENGKPAPDAYIVGAKSLGFSPNECIVLEDAENGVEAGHRAGAFTIAVPNRFNAKCAFNSADFVCSDLHQAVEYLSI